MRKIVNFVRSIYFNFRYLPFSQAIRIPIWVTMNLGKCDLRRGQLVLNSPIKRKQILIGGGSRQACNHFKLESSWITAVRYIFMV